MSEEVEWDNTKPMEFGGIEVKVVDHVEFADPETAMKELGYGAPDNEVWPE